MFIKFIKMIQLELAYVDIDYRGKGLSIRPVINL